MPQPSPLALAVVVDGTPMEDEAARALWARFSAWMEEHRGDLAGFAAHEGFASVHPGVEGGRPILRLSRTTPQLAYAAITAITPEARSGGSHSRQTEGPSPDQRGRRTSRKHGKNRPRR